MKFKKSTVILLTCILLNNEFMLYVCPNTITEITACHNKNSTALTETVVKLVDVISGSLLHLWCHFCEEQEDYQARLWYYRRRGNNSFTEIEYNIDDDWKISISPFHTLNIHNFNYNDSGIYVCINVEKNNSTAFTYVLEGIFYSNVSPKIGTINQWKEYKHEYLDSINEKFKKSQEEPFKSLQNNSAYSYELVTTWDNWDYCKIFDYPEGTRKKIGRCRLHVKIMNNILKKHPMFITSNEKPHYYFNDGYDYSCRSLELNEILPEISKIIRNLPEFEAVETCTVFSQYSENEHFLQIKTKHVAENSHLILLCSDINHSSDIKWYKDGFFLDSSIRNNLEANKEKPHITKDIHNSLHILHVTKVEEGNYTCVVDGKTKTRFEIKVMSKTTALNQEFIRYSIYLGFVLSLTIIFYCAGICVAWHRKASFVDPLNYKKIKTNCLFCERAKLLE